MSFFDRINATLTALNNLGTGNKQDPLHGRYQGQLGANPVQVVNKRQTQTRYNITVADDPYKPQTHPSDAEHWGLLRKINQMVIGRFFSGGMIFSNPGSNELVSCTYFCGEKGPEVVSRFTGAGLWQGVLPKTNMYPLACHPSANFPTVPVQTFESFSADCFNAISASHGREVQLYKA